MQTKLLHCTKWFALPIFLGLATFANAQQSSPTQKPTQDSASARSTPDRDINNRDELARFDQFLDSHREIAEQLRKDPSLVNDRKFVKDHPALQSYLQEHPQTRDALKNDPNIFMKDEAREKPDRDIDRRELANFDRFLDNHRETAQQLRRDPSLVDNSQYMRDHPELQTYLQDHPAVRQQIKVNPDAFMHAEDRYDRAEDNRSHDLDRNEDRGRDREIASFDQFLDTHRETGEQLRKNPSLADNQQFLKDHPALQSYLQDHPAVREQLRQDPNVFMQQEARYDRREDDMNRPDAASDRDHGNGDDRNRNADDRDRGSDSDRDGDAHRHFAEFLGNHGDIAQQLSKDPSLVKRQDYLQDHPELRDYLNQHPEVQQPLMVDPQNFVSKSQQFNTNGQPVKNSTAAPAASPTGTAKPNKQ